MDFPNGTRGFVIGLAVGLAYGRIKNWLRSRGGIPRDAETAR